MSGYFLTAVHLDDNFIAEPIAEEIHAAGENQRQDRPLTTAKHIADPDQQSGKDGQQDRGTKGIHTLSSFSRILRFKRAKSSLLFANT